MKTTFCIALLIALAACSNTGKDGFSIGFSKGVKADLRTGAKTTYSGFAVENIYLVNADDQQLGSNELPLNSKFSVVYEGVANYTQKEGKVFPGLSMEVTDEAGNFILNEADLFSSYTDGFEAETASVLRGTVTVGEPMQAGQSYNCKVRVFDKNSDAELVTTLKFKVKE
ncbi:MAG: hypothetical protein KF775_06880 [Cyclobacteriaceae bacterium]|nr:hypothetical protein [Cyclobacteriaceae bacterium]